MAWPQVRPFEDAQIIRVVAETFGDLLVFAHETSQYLDLKDEHWGTRMSIHAGFIDIRTDRLWTRLEPGGRNVPIPGAQELALDAYFAPFKAGLMREAEKLEHRADGRGYRLALSNRESNRDGGTRVGISLGSHQPAKVCGGCFLAVPLNEDGRCEECA